MKSTWGCEAGLFGGEHLLSSPPDVAVDIAEGEWDCIALTYLHAKTDNNTQRVVVGVPGATTFKAEWSAAFKGRSVTVWYDHGQAGEKGDALVTKRLHGRVAALRYVHWPSDKADGYDLRDAITVALRNKKPKGCWRRLCGYLRDQPRQAPDAVDSPNADDALDGLYNEWVYAYGTKRMVYVGSDSDTRTSCPT